MPGAGKEALPVGVSDLAWLEGCGLCELVSGGENTDPRSRVDGHGRCPHAGQKRDVRWADQRALSDRQIPALQIAAGRADEGSGLYRVEEPYRTIGGARLGPLDDGDPIGVRWASGRPS